MGTMLITSRTPRITYKIGMRAGLGAWVGESLPGLISEAPSIEVAAEFTGIYRILMWRIGVDGENRELHHYQSTNRNGRLARLWHEMRS